MPAGGSSVPELDAVALPFSATAQTRRREREPVSPGAGNLASDFADVNGGSASTLWLPARCHSGRPSLKRRRPSVLRPDGQSQ